MAILDTLENEFVKRNLTEGNTPELVKAIVSSIYSPNVPYRMKLAIAYSELILFFSQFRINIKHWNDSIIPINALTFCIARSGASKDSSISACRKCFASGYAYIEHQRKEVAKNRAISKAREKDIENPESFAAYKEFYKTPNPLFISISTPEGFIQHLNDLKYDIAGSGHVQISELGAEMISNPNFNEIVKNLAELYDEGNKAAKIIKNKEQQNKAVHNFPVNALFLGSPSNILYDDSIKKKFKMEFTSKLARRSFFIYANEDFTTDLDLPVNELIRLTAEREDKAIKARDTVNKYIGEVVKDFMNDSTPNLITVSKEVRDLFNFYKMYNEAQGKIISERLPMTKLSRQHLQWKAFKLAGALALSEGAKEIEEAHYKAGIEYCELISDDIHNFELELIKEPYELFCAYTHEYEIDGTYQIELHELRKAGFISSKGLISTSMKELVKLANSYDKSGIYEYKDKDNIITYRKKEECSYILLSSLPCVGSKSARKTKCASGFICEETTFNVLEQMLQGDYAYTCFKFANGVRGKENIISTTRWIILDIDDSECTDIEAHYLLSGINHYVVRTSNKEVATKYRVLIELDKEVNIPDYYWISFIQFIASDLGLVADKRPKSMIFFSYSDRTIYKELEGVPLAVDPYLRKLTNYDKNKSLPYKQLTLTEKEKAQLLDDPLTTFHKAYNALDGEGRIKLIWAAKYARELGASKQYTKDLLYNISQEYWVRPLDKRDFDIMMRQIDRWQGFSS